MQWFKQIKMGYIVIMGLIFSFMFTNCKPGNAIDNVIIPEKPPIIETVKTIPKIKAEKSVSEIRVGDTSSLITISFKDSATDAFLSYAYVSAYSGNFSLYAATGSETLKSPDTISSGSISFRMKAGIPGTGSIQIRVRTAALVERVLSLTITANDSTSIPLPPQHTRNLYFTALRSTLKADGNDSATMLVLLKDENNNPMSGEKIKFTATGGLVTASDVTDEGGKAKAILISERANKTVTVVATVVGQDLSSRQQVTFSGIKLTINPQKNVLIQGSRDSVTFELADANGVIISGDSIAISVTGADGGFAEKSLNNTLIATDTKGQYKTYVTSKTAKDVVITALALGADASQTITFSSDQISVSAVNSSIVGDGVSTTQVSVSLKNANNAPISGADLKWTTTFGTIVGTPFSVTGANGSSTVTLKSSKGTGIATVNVEAKLNGKLLASGSVDVQVTAQKVSRLVMRVTPDNIPVKVGEAKLIAQAFDKEDNVMDDVLIGFILVKGAGGGDELIKPAIDYTKQGFAQSSIFAGSVTSFFQSVRVAAVALDNSGPTPLVIASSDTVSLTFSGPAARLSVGHDTQKGENPNDGTFALPVSAIVTDVNGNLVADGTPVNFSVTPIMFKDYYSGTDPAYNYYYEKRKTDSLIHKFRWTDYNNNGKLDDNEEQSPKANNLGVKLPLRGEDIDGNGYVNASIEFTEEDDINGNGTRDSGDAVEERYLVPYYYGGDTTKGVQYYMQKHVEINGNNQWDSVENYHDLNKNGKCECPGTYDSNGVLIEFKYHKETPNNKPFPGDVAVGIAKQVVTEGGKAVNKIKYVKSQAWIIDVRISAEANGIKAQEDFNLPVILDGGK